MVLGDSFAYGIGAGDEETYPFLLERELTRSGRAAEVLNAGIYGSGTGEQVVWYEGWLSRFKPQVVILTVYENDHRNDRERPAFRLAEDGTLAPLSQADLRAATSGQDSARSLTRLIPGYTYLSQHSHLMNFFRGTAVALLHPTTAPATPPPTPSPSKPPPEDFRLLGLEIERLHSLVSNAGSRLVVVFVPPRFSVRGTQETERLDRHIAATRAAAERLAIPFRDLTQHMKDTPTRPLYFERDMHCTPAGYHALAEGVADFLVREGLVVAQGD